MSVTRRGLTLLLACLGLAGCSGLPLLGGNPSGVEVVGDSTYCGTPSQNSEVHYFSGPEAFGSWIDYRNISNFNRNMAQGGLLIVEMGQRPTGGYDITLNGEDSGVQDDTLRIVIDWYAPRLDAAVSQALTSQCIALKLPAGAYHEVEIVDQLGNSRGAVEVQPPSAD
jgi:hypothetical protein